MIADLRIAAEAVGITAIITNSNEKIETQLNRITGVEDLPIMLISWDLETSLQFNQHGFLNNPVTNVVLLLMDKPEDRTKDVAESTAEAMANLYQQFMQSLYNQLVQYQKVQGEEMLTNISYTLVPKHGLGKHSGVMGRFTMQTAIVEDC